MARPYTSYLASITVLVLLVAARPGRPASASLPGPVVRGTIEYVRSIESVREFSKPRSIWGKLLERVAGPAETPQLLRPYAVTQDSAGRLIVADTGQRVVHIFDFEHRSYRFIPGERRRPLGSPVGVAVDRSDNIYVSDSAQARILVFDRNGKFLRVIGDPARGVELRRPTGLAIDREQQLLYVCDTLRHEVLVLNLAGTLVRTIGRRGVGPGEFNFPTSLAISGETLYVVDAMNFRVQAFARNGRFLHSFGKLGHRTGTFNRPKGIAADNDGNLYIVDGLFETVQVFDPEGHLLYYFGSPGRGPGQFVLPAGIYIDPRNRIFVADTYNRRIQEFRYRRVNP
jgi:sugar lactone lactonase YvrE